MLILRVQRVYMLLKLQTFTLQRQELVKDLTENCSSKFSYLDLAVGPALGMRQNSPERCTLTPILGGAISKEKFLEFCNI